MDKNKFESEVEVLKSFFGIYCAGQEHQQRKFTSFTYTHQEFTSSVELLLCEECQALLRYSLNKLQNCPHEIKPRCRTCIHPCYEKREWKSLSKVMRFSGLKLGVLKVKKIVNLFF
jgi:hypothetical protein